MYAWGWTRKSSNVGRIEKQQPTAYGLKDIHDEHHGRSQFNRLLVLHIEDADGEARLPR
jgi:hypothetical protein